MSSRWLKWIIWLLFVISAWQFGTVAYIHAKAVLAQHLIEQAWQQTRQQQVKVPPWPWADTWPVARLQVARLGIDFLVLAGSSGRTLAFAPGWMKASEMPGQAGWTFLAGHRDTHFEFLQDLVEGDTVTIELADRRLEYRVDGHQVVDSKAYQLNLQSVGSDLDDDLLLVTCYSFNALVSGRVLRYLVNATAL